MVRSMFKVRNTAVALWRLSLRASPEAPLAALHCLPMAPPFPAQCALPEALLGTLNVRELLGQDTS